MEEEEVTRIWEKEMKFSEWGEADQEEDSAGLEGARY
jgi:hypothetical protein